MPREDEIDQESVRKYLSSIGRKGGKASAGKPRNIDPEVAKQRAIKASQAAKEARERKKEEKK